VKILELDFETFKQIVLQNIERLNESGYHYEERGIPDVVYLAKPLVSGVHCRIGFQLKWHFFSPVQRFNVWLYRTRTKDFPEENVSFLPLVINLRNLMGSVYQIQVFAPGQFFWEFTDEQSLAKQISSVEKLLLDYGIRWLEDPDSDIQWMRSRE
jgi:hypothetical protein